MLVLSRFRAPLNAVILLVEKIEALSCVRFHHAMQDRKFLTPPELDIHSSIKAL